MFKSTKLLLLIMPILSIVSAAQAENNIIHLWTDSTLSNTVAIDSRNNNVFLVDRNYGMVVMAISDSIAPQFVSSYDPGVPIYDIDVHGTYAFLAAGINESHNGWILIVDIESSANPIYIGAFVGDTVFTRVAVDTYAYGVLQGTLKIINISDPANPVEAGSFSVSNVVDIFARGNYVYLACQNLGLKIIDVSSPVSPVLVGTCDTPGIASGVAMRTNDSTHVYIADGPSGIQIIDISTPANPYIQGSFQTEADAISIAGGRYSVYATLSDSTVAAVLVGNPGYTRLVGISDIPHDPKGIALYGSGNSIQGIAVVDGYMLDIYKIHTTPCPRFPGDINGNGSFNGIDVTYAVSYFKGGAIPPQSCQCWSHPNFCTNCDVNASCQFNGVDITYIIGIFDGRNFELLPCPDCPEAY